MDQTDCFDIPFPECDPPLTKDASDVEQFRDLALATDTAVAQLDAQITEFLTSPDSAVASGGLTAAGRIQDLPFTVSEFENKTILSAVDARLKIATDGWYIIGGWVSATHGVDAGIGIRIQPTLNGDPVSNRQGPGRPVLTGASATDDVGWLTVMQLSVGDLLGARTNHAGSTSLSVTYAHRIWLTRIVANV